MSNLIDQVLEFGMADLFNEKSSMMAPDYAVCAGDPASRPSENDGLIIIPSSQLDGMKQFVVDGYSMSPRFVDDGDNVLAKALDGDYDSIKEGDMLIVKVDPGYYEREVPRYKYKLRSAIMVVDENWNEKDIISHLQEMEGQSEIWLKRYRNCLHTKYQKARSHYPDGRLMLSATYKNGLLQYSFHKLDFIAYKAELLIKENNPDKMIQLPIAA